MTQEELTITVMLTLMTPDRNQIRAEIEHIEDLLVRHRLFRKWVQDPEGADLFSEDLAEVEAELAKKESKRAELMEEYNRLERKCNWLDRQLEVIQFRSGRGPKEVLDDDELPF